MQRPRQFSTSNGRDTLHSKMAVHTCIFRLNCNLYQAPSVANCQSPISAHSSPQCRWYAQEKKPRFFNEAADNFGHVISSRRLEIAPYTTDAINRLKRSTNVTEFRSFLGLCDTFWLFFLCFERLAAPLNAKQRKGRSGIFEAFKEKVLRFVSLLKNCDDIFKNSYT